MNNKMDIIQNQKISVVICAFSSKRLNLTLKCIHSIFENSYKNYEIILVIDGNKDLKNKIEEKFKGINNIKIIDNIKNEGPSFSRNRGVEIAKGDIIAFIDDDAYASNNWLENIINNFYNFPEISVVGGKVLPDYENGSKKLPEELLWIVGGTYKGHPEHRQLIRNVFSGNMAVKKDIFRYINFETMYNKKNKLSHQLEDTLFCVNLNDNLKKILYDPNTIVYHHIHKDRLRIGYLLKRAFSEGILKAKLEHTNNKNRDKEKENKTLSTEYSYLNTILSSIIKDFLTLKFRDCVLLLLMLLTVSSGYANCTFKERINNLSKRKNE